MTHADPEETRAYARLPGLDIAVLHRRGVQGGDGEQVVVALRAVPAGAAADNSTES